MYAGPSRVRETKFARTNFDKLLEPNGTGPMRNRKRREPEGGRREEEDEGEHEEDITHMGRGGYAGMVASGKKDSRSHKV